GAVRTDDAQCAAAGVAAAPYDNVRTRESAVADLHQPLTRLSANPHRSCVGVIAAGLVERAVPGHADTGLTVAVISRPQVSARQVVIALGAFAEVDFTTFMRRSPALVDRAIARLCILDPTHFVGARRGVANVQPAMIAGHDETAAQINYPGGA